MSVIDKEPKERGAHWLPDIVEELRADADAGIGWAASNLRRAADEIERLRAALSWIEDQDPQIVDAARAKFGIADPRLLGGGRGI